MTLTIRTVNVTVRYEGDTAVVAVADTGIGMRAKDLMFGDQYPSDDAFIHAHEGSGISLLFTKVSLDCFIS
jgi:signal transduction histidine kinase